MCPAVSSLKFVRPLGYKRPSSEKQKCDLDNKIVAKVYSRIEQNVPNPQSYPVRTDELKFCSDKL
jgi:hypothetical protein